MFLDDGVIIEITSEFYVKKNNWQEWKRYDTLKSEKEQPPTRWVDLDDWIERPPYQQAKVKRVVFSMFVYLQNVKTNVSKAIRKSPKDNKSWKSNLFRFFISSTSILWEWRSTHPVTRLFHKYIIAHIEQMFNIKLKKLLTK